MSQQLINHAPQPCAWYAGTGNRALSVGYVISCLVCGGKGHILVTHPAGSVGNVEALGGVTRPLPA